MTLFKSLIYRGFPYIDFGYGGIFTNAKTGINKVWYVFDYPIILKTRITNMDKPFRQFVIDKILSNPELTIEKDVFDDRGEYVPISEEGKANTYTMYSVVATNSNGKFYVGSIRDSYYMSSYSNFMNSNIRKTEGVAAIAKDDKNHKWCGWSHRAHMCFGIGDKVFESDYGDEETLYRLHGSVTIKTEGDMVEKRQIR